MTLVGDGPDPAELADLRRAVLDAAEAVAHGRASGSLTHDDLDRLVTTHRDYSRHRLDSLRTL